MHFNQLFKKSVVRDVHSGSFLMAYLTSQGEERKFQVFTLELETLNPLDSLPVSSEMLVQLQKATEQDTELQSLKTTVLAA